MNNFVKRVLSLLCVLSLFLTIDIISFAQVETTISVESQTIEQGNGIEIVDVPIKVSDNTGILGMTISVTFDEELALVSAVNGDALSNLTFTTSKSYTDTPYNLVWDGQHSAETNDGVIAILTFEVPKETPKDYSIYIAASGVFDGNVQQFDPVTVNGKISVIGGTEMPKSETTISVESQAIEQGNGIEIVDVPIKVSDNTGILGMTISVTFDNELTLVGALNGDALSDLTFTTSKSYTDIPYNLVWDGQHSAETNDGVIAILTFEVPKETPKDYSIYIAASGVFDGNVQQFNPVTENGKITVNEDSSSDDTILDSGTDLNGIKWTLYETGLLDISGTGAMTDYSRTSDIPWYSDKLLITEVVIGKGVNHIAERAFYGCLYLEKITIPTSVNSIGTYAFRNCDDMTIYGESNSYAETYAIENDIPFVNTKPDELKDITIEYTSTTRKMYFDISVDDYSGNAMVWVALYDSNEVMIDLISEEFVVDDITSLSLNKNTNASYVKVFVWENELKPVTRVEIISDL